MPVHCHRRRQVRLVPATSGDSLAGRYFLFHLNPLTLSEVAGRPRLEPAGDESALEFIERKLSFSPSGQDLVDQLLHYSGFPEPFLKVPG